MIARVLEALVTEPARVHLEASVLLQSASARRVRRIDYLEAWEYALEITAPAAEPAARAEAIARKLSGHVSLGRAAYAEAAARHGFSLVSFQIHNDTFFRAGVSAVGDAVRDDGWAFVFDLSVVGPDDAAAAAALLAEVTALSRAHTVVRLVGTVGPVLSNAVTTTAGDRLITTTGDRVVPNA